MGGGSIIADITTPDLETCAREPIHIPGAIQPHGALFVLRASDMIVVQASINVTDYLGDDIVVGERPRGAVGGLLDSILQWHQTPEPTLQIPVAPYGLIVVAHRSGRSIIVEAEREEPQTASQTFTSLRSFVQTLAQQADHDASLQVTARFLRQLTGFDRTLVYQFDEDWNGQVVAEAGNGALPSYLDLRFPASDIPAQARALYATNPVRIIPNATYDAVPIIPVANPDTQTPLDLSFAQLRSVSPVHLEYMRNMGTAASMSVSIMIDGRLWGLVSCHSAAPHYVGIVTRDVCELIVQSLAMRIAAQQREVSSASRAQLGRITSRLLTLMSSGTKWPEELIDAGDDLQAQVGADGAAIITETGYFTVGECPREDEVRTIVRWLEEERSDADLVASHSLASELPPASAFAASASGVLAVRISELHPSWVIWFRPEVVRTVKWGGNPHKLVTEEGRIHPRNSFDAWREQVHQQAKPWTESELSAARDLRRAIVGIVLRRAEELAELTSELRRSNKELEAFSYSVSHDLRAPFRHIVGFAQLLRERETSLDAKSQHYLRNISESALAAGRLVDDLLNFSQLGRASIASKNVDMNKLVEEVIKSVMLSRPDRQVEWKIGRLPTAWGDATLLRQVWYNLIDNAVKYSRDREPAVISIDGSTADDVTVYSISDNGVGFDMAYVGKLFGVFQRLQRAEDFDGTGIGLALVRRIVERHNGTVKATGEEDKGATFTFALPTPEKKGRALA
ncbi:ATP-binding protein [Pseudorhizobium pelagicum]|uniref:ATP-binding protein n=1 Tax=Pseudorhizobium pelagicum TaxID=1509405 RepID=UPI000A9E6650|nr:ATP-binding protein [Pseudorhizobium pelagicum]